MFTVMIAAFTLIASLVISWITLGRNERQFRQNRIDALRDRLRAEIVDLNTALVERISRIDVAGARMMALADEAYDEAQGFDDERSWMYRRVKALLSEELSDVYRRIQSHAAAIMLLTSERAAADPAFRILVAATEEFESHFDIIPESPDEEVAQNQQPRPDSAEAKRPHRDRLETLQSNIELAREELWNFALYKLPPAMT